MNININELLTKLEELDRLIAEKGLEVMAMKNKRHELEQLAGISRRPRGY